MKPKCSSPGGVSLTPYIGGGTSGSATPPTSLQVLPVGTHQIIIGYGPPQGSSGQRSKSFTPKARKIKSVESAHNISPDEAAH